jgi:hypothetical protein
VTFDPAWLLLSLVPSGAGFVLFTYGRKQVRIPQLAAGIALMVYPYFTGTLWSLTLVGVAIGVALYAALHLGY